MTYITSVKLSMSDDGWDPAVRVGLARACPTLFQVSAYAEGYGKPYPYALDHCVLRWTTDYGPPKATQ